MHSIPNVAFGKVANRSVVRVFFPRMYTVMESKKIPIADLESIYDHCLRPIIQRLMFNQATHWPPNYRTVMETSRTGHLHFRSLDIPSHHLHDLSRDYLNSLENLGEKFRDAYFGHELRGWKAATVHNLVQEAEEVPELGAAHERVGALEDLTRVLHMEEINPEQWLIDVGLEFGVPGKVVTWRTLGHQALVRFLLPDLDNPGRALSRSKKYYVDHQMHLKDLAGFRWSPGTHSELIHYIQAYTTEKAISYQLHTGIFSQRKASELLSRRLCTKLISDLERQGEILHTCTGDSEVEPEDRRPHEGCARLEVRVCLAEVDHALVHFPQNLLNRTMVQIPAGNWWFVILYVLPHSCPHDLFVVLSHIIRYLKWLRLAAVHRVLSNLSDAPSKERSSESSLALGAMMIWILNGAHRTPAYRLLSLAEQACPQILTEDVIDPEDPDAVTAPLMYEAGIYFICDLVADSRTHFYRMPYSKEFDSQSILQAYEKGTMNELDHILGVGELQIGPLQPHTDRTSNRSTRQTMDVCHFRPQDRPLPAIGPSLNGILLPNPPRPHGPDVDYFVRHGGGNRQPVPDDDEPHFQDAPHNPLKSEVRIILEQMFFDILQESPNKKSQLEGAWTNIPQALRHELAVEDLYLTLDLPFYSVQCNIASTDQWALHFDRFFPPTVPQKPAQNFGKSRYFNAYLNLVRRLSSRQLTRVRSELQTKFNTLAWIPHTESDHMWCTRRMASTRWMHLPKGSMEGPKISVNPLVLMRLGGRPRLRPPPRLQQLQQEDEEAKEAKGED